MTTVKNTPIISENTLQSGLDHKKAVVAASRHPEKAKRAYNPSPIRKPSWLRVKAAMGKKYDDIRAAVKKRGLSTVCEEAGCPNLAECWASGHITLMILGERCTRGCNFCAVATGKPETVDPLEPEKVAQTVKELNQKHIVITSVNRDDLPDGGALQFLKVVQCIRRASPQVTIELLTPDFLNKATSLDIITQAAPHILNHNLETVPRLYKNVRPGARYFSSLYFLKMAKEKARENNVDLFTKSGIMVGLGEMRSEVLQVMDDMRAADIDFLTIGHYLQPTARHYPMERYVSIQEFDEYAKIAKAKGFSMVSSSPLTRSSYHAQEDYEKLLANKANKRRNAQR